MKNFYSAGRQLLALSALLAIPGPGFAQAPTVTGLMPTRNDVTASPSGGVSISFSQPMSSSPSSLGSVRVFGEQSGGRRAGTPFGSSNHLVFAPTANFLAGERVRVSVTSAAQALNGFFLAKGHVYDFTAATSGTGQGYFSPPNQNDLPVGSPTGGEYVGDVDGDGDLDALIGETATGQITLYRNLGTGGLVPQGFAGSHAGGIDMCGADFDGDGDTDLVTINLSNDFVIQLNSGTGFLGTNFFYSAGAAGLHRVDAGDLDGDGDQDVVTWHTGTGNNGFVTHRNNFLGTFNLSVPYTLPTAPADGKLADVDNDGDLDVVTVTSTTSQVLTYLNNGSGVFTPGPVSSLSGFVPTALEMGDLDLDGDLDAAIACPSNLGSIVMYNNGSGTFGGLTFLLDGPVMDLKIGDVDADGQPDIVTTVDNGGHAMVSVWPNVPGPSFSRLRLQYLQYTLSQTVPSARLLLADLDADGDLDVIARSPTELLLRFNAPSLESTRRLPGWPLLTGARTDNLYAYFNQAMDGLPTSLNSLQVFSAQRGGRLAASRSAYHNTLQLDPTNDFRAGEVISATVTNQATSLTLNTLPQGRTWQFTAAATGGPANFIAKPDVPVAANADGVELGDFNNDGILDLVTANFFPGTVTVRMGTGGGLFNPTGPTISLGLPRRCAVGDIDNDGDLDIAVSSWAGVVGLLTNNGAGAFALTTTPLGGGAYGITLADMNGDANLDLITANYSSNNVSVRFGNGAGAFSGGGNYATGTGCQGLAVGDFNMDGFLDVAATNHTANSVSVRLNDGVGGLSGGQDMPTAGQPWNIAVADYDANGFPDLLVAGNGVELAPNLGGGAFPGFTNSVSSGAGTFDVNPADVDGDGDFDLVATRIFPGAALVAINTFGVYGSPLVVPLGQNMLSLAVGDLDNDLDLDFVAADANLAQINVRLNQLPPFVITALAPTRNALNVPVATNVDVTFSQPVLNAPLSANSVKVFSAQAGGKKSGGISVSGATITVNPNVNFKPGEVVSVTTTTAATNAPATQNLAPGHVYQFTAAAGTGPGVFVNGTTYASAGVNLSDVAAADVDNDGDVDALVVGFSSNLVEAWLNNGSGGFSLGTTATLPNSPNGITTGDLDNDGDLDFVTVHQSAGAAYVGLNNGTGTFAVSLATQLPGGSSATQGRLADVDADGDLDLVITDYNFGVQVRFNNGAGAFSGTGGTSIAGLAHALAMGDIDSDGDLDLVAGEITSSIAHVRFNTGAGTFGGLSNVTTASGGINAAVLADFDADGDLDLATATAFGSDVSIRVNNGSGTFSGTQTISIGGIGYDLKAADVDGDGDLDLVAMVFGSPNTVVLLNNGAGTFGLGSTQLIGGNPRGLALADIDADGDVDLLGVESSLNALVVRFNEFPDLIISTTMNVPNGPWHNITVTGTGNATLTGNQIATGNVVVQTGGVWNDGCFLLYGLGTFTLQPGAKLTICHNQGITLAGNTGCIRVTGTRSYSPTADYEYLRPSGAQVTGNGLTGARDLTVNAPSGLSLTTAASITRLLTLTATSGNFTLGGQNLTLLSTVAQTAMVVNAGAGAVLGSTTTVQRYITPGLAPGLGYRHMTAPVSGSTVSDLQTTGVGAYTPIVNPAFDAQTNPMPTPFANIYGFNETLKPTSANFSYGWFSPLTLGDPLTPGRGYSVYMNPVTPDFNGTLGNGNLPMTNLTRTGAFLGNTQKSGWHLLGNPYPAPLGWDLAVPGPGPGQIPTGMSNSISVYQSTGGNNGLYLTRAAGIGSLPNGHVAMGQAFFARVTGTGPLTFTFTNGLRLTSYANPPHYRAALDTRPMLSLSLHAVGAPAAAVSEAFVYADAGATPALDDRFDGPVPGRNVGVPTLVSLTPQADELAVNGLPETLLTQPTTVELLADLPQAGAYELALGQRLNLDGVTVALLDRLTGTRYDLARQPRLTFRAGQPGELRERFALIFNPIRPTGLTTPDVVSAPLSVWPNPAHENVRISGLPAGTVGQLLDATGRVVRTSNERSETSNLDLRGLAPGVYTVRAADGRTARLVVD